MNHANLTLALFIISMAVLVAWSITLLVFFISNIIDAIISFIKYIKRNK